MADNLAREASEQIEKDRLDQDNSFSSPAKTKKNKRKQRAKLTQLIKQQDEQKVESDIVSA